MRTQRQAHTNPAMYYAPRTTSFSRGAYSRRGMTLIDVVVGAALMLLVFVGIASAFQLAVDVVMNNKARAGAIALCNERMEYMRSLSYTSVGTVGGIPSGVVPQTETLTYNGIAYTRTVFVAYADDPKDGTGAADTNAITADYKVIRVDTAWQGKGGARHVTLVGRVSPVTIEQAVPGGTLVIRVVDSLSQPVANATVTIVNAGASPAVNLTTYTDSAGTATFIGAPAASGYQITATKTGYSTAQTYSATAQNTNPQPAHLTVSLNQTTNSTFAIDRLTEKTVQTYAAIQAGTWVDPMNDTTKIASSTYITVASGVARLSGSAGSYPVWGALRSSSIAPSTIARWGMLRATTTQPSGTAVRYRLYDADDVILPDSALAGNSAGFTSPSLSLAGVSTSTYRALRIHADLTTTNANLTPSVDAWEVGYEYGPTPLPSVSFSVRGSKTIGSGPTGPVYKYDATFSSGALAGYTITALEWDTYTTSVSALSGYDIASACAPQPEGIAAGAAQLTKLYLAPHTTHSLLVDVKTADGMVVPNASVRLYRTSPAYNTTIISDGCGQVFFPGIAPGSPASGNAYSISVTATGYTPYTSTAVTVNGTSRLSVVVN